MNHCYESGRPEQIDIGLQVLQGCESIPTAEQMTNHYTDLRNYMPAIAKQSASKLVPKTNNKESNILSL